MLKLITSIRNVQSQKGMTLVETLVAVSILALAIVAPMSLTMQSLSAAYYSRDQVVMSNLAQEGVEAVRAIRDRNILLLGLGLAPASCPDGLPYHILCGIEGGQDFTIDARLDASQPDAIDLCSGTCPNLMTDGNLYGHSASGWLDTPYESQYRRTVSADYVAGGSDEIRITVTVQRTDTPRPPPDVVIVENLYRWVEDGIGQ